jgi:hypothetical protein
MDYTDILPIAQQFVNVKAVALAVLITQGTKYWILPCPAGAEKKSEVVPGSITTRLLPFLPVLIGILFCTLVERTATVMEDTIRGIFTGMTAAFAYRTTKVSIFGQ